MITGDTVRLIASNREVESWTIAADIMQPPVVLQETATLRRAAEALLRSGLRELLVVSDAGQIIGLLDQNDLSRAVLDRSRPVTEG